MQSEGDSQFNMAMATLQRMDCMLREANIAARDKDAVSWFEILMGLYRELEPFFSKNPSFTSFSAVLLNSFSVAIIEFPFRMS